MTAPTTPYPYRGAHVPPLPVRPPWWRRALCWAGWCDWRHCTHCDRISCDHCGHVVGDGVRIAVGDYVDAWINRRWCGLCDVSRERDDDDPRKGRAHR